MGKAVALVLIVFTCAIGARGEPLNLQAAQQLADSVASLDTDQDTRIDAENRLMEAHFSVVLPSLAPHFSKELPRGAIHNSMGAEADRKAPPKWQAYHSLHRIWSRHTLRDPSAEKGRVLVSLVERPDCAGARSLVAMALWRNWTDEAEEPLAAILPNPAEHRDARYGAAGALLAHRPAEYHDAVVEIARKADHDLKNLLFGVLVENPHFSKYGFDPAVVCLGYDLIEDERKKDPDYAHAGYFPARHLGKYLSIKFAPEQKLYEGEHGLKDEFFRTTTDNALRYWEKTRANYEAALLPVVSINIRQLVNQAFIGEMPSSVGNIFIGEAQVQRLGVCVDVMHGGKNAGRVEVGIFADDAAAAAAFAEHVLMTNAPAAGTLKGPRKWAAWGDGRVVFQRRNVVVNLQGNGAQKRAHDLDAAIGSGGWADNGVRRGMVVPVPRFADVQVPDQVMAGTTAKIMARIALPAGNDVGTIGWADSHGIAIAPPVAAPADVVLTVEHPVARYKERTQETLWLCYATPGCVIASHKVTLTVVPDAGAAK